MDPQALRGCGEPIGETEVCAHIVTGDGIGGLSHVSCLERAIPLYAGVYATPGEWDKFVSAERDRRRQAP